ncbi:MAG: serine/threonine protein kinase, bacterial [Mycobacterium sp.]|nr:serine/threonine protein kinase, bacterial [Mycobacterium sp.]
MPLAGGTEFAGYSILRLLGTGGMGEVYLAQHPRLPRQDALKVLRANISAEPGYRQRFNREAELAAKLFHQHIVGIHDCGEFDSRLWISMDYIFGTDAGRMLHHQYPRGMPLPMVIDIIKAVGGALDYAHARGLLHRDIKPANILVAHPDNGERRILLSDFGVARDVGDASDLTATNITVGTIAYCAPEQLMGLSLDGRADQYALGATAYHLLGGVPMFSNSNPAVIINAHLNAHPPPLAARNPDLALIDAAVFKALAKNPGDRFATCSEFARALADSANGTPTAFSVSAPTAMTAPRPTTPARHPRQVFALAGAALFLAICVGTYFGLRALTTPETNQSFVLNGSVHLTGNSFTTTGLSNRYHCAGTSTYADVGPDAPVIAANEAGTVLAKGSLKSSDKQQDSCILRLEIDDVPAGAKFYRVRVGRQSESTYTEAEARAGIDIPLGNGELPAPPTVTATPRSTPTTTPSPSITTPPIPDPQSAALGQLQQIAASDRPLALKWLRDRWVPQLSSKYNGLRAEEVVWDYVAILNEHQQLRARWGESPGVLLLWSPDWSTFDANRGYWVTIAGQYSPDYHDALAWCASQGRDRDHCYAKLISTTHGPQDSSEYN